MPRPAEDKPLNSRERAEIAYWSREPTTWDEPLTPPTLEE